MTTDPNFNPAKWMTDNFGFTADQAADYLMKAKSWGKWISTEPNGAYPIEDDVTKQFYIYGLNVDVTLPRSEMPKDFQLVLSRTVNYGRNY